MGHTLRTGRINRSTFTIFIAAIAALTLTLAGCGSSTAKSSGDANKLTVAIASAVSTLSVNQEAGSANYQLAALYQEGLTGVDGTGKVIPALATSWKSSDNKSWVFTLRKNVKLHDGSTLTADDIVYAINVARDSKKSPGLSVYWPNYVQSAEKTGDDQITITLSSPHSDFPIQVSNVAGLFVTSKKFFDEAGSNYGSSKKLIVGTGPYKVTEFDPSSHVTLTKFKDYWGKNNGPQTVRVDFVTEDSTRQLAFTSGKVDVSFNVPVTSVAQWQKNGASTTAYADRSYYGLTFDPNVAPFNDIHVRRAVSYAVDKKAIVSGILKGYGEVATGIDSPEQLAGWTNNDASKAAKQTAKLPAISYDMKKAKAELKQSSKPDGFTATLTYPTGYAQAGKASLAIAQNLKELGITLNVKEVPLEQWLSDIGNGKQGIGWMIYNPTTPQPNEVTSWLLAAGGSGTNPANWNNAEVAAETDKVGTLDKESDKLALVLKSTTTALDEDIYSPIYWGKSVVATAKGVKLAKIGTFWLGTNWAADFSKNA